jgi:hypothetical protein
MLHNGKKEEVQQGSKTSYLVGAALLSFAGATAMYMKTSGSMFTAATDQYLGISPYWVLKITQNPVDFAKANDRCAGEEGTALASVHSSAQNAEMETAITAMGVQHAWIGLENPGSYAWVDGTTVDYTNMGSPLDTNCVYFSDDSKWYVAECSLKLNAFFCAAPSTSTGNAIDNYYAVLHTVESGVGIDWSSANTQCNDVEGTTLVSVHNQTQNDQMFAMMKGLGLDYGYIGLNDIATEDVFFWEDGSVRDYYNFADGQPDNYNGNEDCVHMYSTTGLWNDIPCATLFDGFFCASRTWRLVVPSSSVTSDIAESNCAADEGTHLASVHTLLQNKRMTDALTAQASGNAYIGFTDVGHEGDFVWMDGTPNNFQAWRYGEPNNSGGNENCAELQSNGGWNDVNCGTAEVAYFCDIK